MIYLFFHSRFITATHYNFSIKPIFIVTFKKIFISCSKIIDKEDGCQHLAQCPEKLVMGFSLILQTHRYNIVSVVCINNF